MRLDGTPSLAIKTSGLTKNYGKNAALTDCNLELPSGRFMALVGPNGAGKSTLLMLLVGLLAPTKGTVSICGHDPRHDRRAVLTLVGFVSQDRPLYPNLSVSETIEMGRRLSPHWNQRIALERVERLGIPFAAKVGTLSGGQRAQVSLTLALGKEPSVLILDEPMASLDPVARYQFLKEVSGAAAERPMAVIMSSHILAELGRVSDHLAILRGGKLLLAGPVEHVDASPDGPRYERADTALMTDLERIVLSYLDD
jgi:ABC-2 type transport system ATP-binding protein